ncbi:MAG: tyrosine--tRNA ligase [Patescibacteria group bacterium]
MNIEFFSRGVIEIIDRNSLESKIQSGKKLRVKLGVDPTSPDIHLGHTVALRKMKELQEEGHQIVFLIGDYTTKIGDPSGRSKTRPMLTDEEIETNAKTYLDQVGKILDVDKSEIRRNSEWFSKMSFNDLLQLLSKFTVAQIMERDDFSNRTKSGIDISIHEIIYPIMQAYDSVTLKADLEMGGTDQRFNLLAGRHLQKKIGQTPQEIMMMKLLVGLDGKEKMSKSLGNYVGITESPPVMFGKIMSIPDSLLKDYFELCTDFPEAAVGAEMSKGPREAKESLALEIVKIYHSAEAAESAKNSFIDQFKNKETPENIPEVELTGTFKIPLFLINIGAVAGSSEAYRLIEQGGVKIDGAKITDPFSDITTKPGMIIQVGKLKYYKIK